MKFYEFIDNPPVFARVVVIEGGERILAERALASVTERILPAGEREFNLDRFDASQVESFAAVEAAVAALPFLGTTRLVVVRGAHALRADPRRALLAVMSAVPEGNVLVVEDLVPPSSKRPEPLAKLFGRAALRIDTTATPETRQRFVRETLAELQASAEPAAFAALLNAATDLAGLRTDLEKLVLLGPKISLADVEAESIAAVDVRAYKFASAAVAGRASEALARAHDLFASDGRNAAVPLLAALAAEYALVWEVARSGGAPLPPKANWRAPELKASARRLGARRAKLGFERAVRGFEALVTGRADDARALVFRLTAAAADAPARRSPEITGLQGRGGQGRPGRGEPLLRSP